jgi:hypothetical protein
MKGIGGAAPAGFPRGLALIQNMEIGLVIDKGSDTVKTSDVGGIVQGR